MNLKTVTLDVREDIRNGREPFSQIMNAVAALGAGDQLLLLAPFEPTPLFGVLAKQGFHHTAQRAETGDWKVVFTRGALAPQETTADSAAVCQPVPGTETDPLSVADVDARGLEPPQPMIKILEALACLPAETELLARTDRRPMHLYSQLEERGFSAETKEESDGSYLTHIRRR